MLQRIMRTFLKLEHLNNRKNMKQDKKMKEKGIHVKPNLTDKCPAFRLLVNFQ